MKWKADDKLSERQAAKYIGVHPATLMRWRQDGKAPAHYAFPGTRVIRYPVKELERFLHDARKRGLDPGGGSLQ